GRLLAPALEGQTVRDGVLTAVEAVTYLDAGFWSHFADPDVGDKILSGELRPGWRKRGFLRGYTDERYSFGRSFSPLDAHRPRDPDELCARNDVVLSDRDTDPAEVTNLAVDPDRRRLVEEMHAKLESLIDAEIGEDLRAWVTERPQLLGWPSWRGDHAA